MTNIPYWKQANSDISLPQDGSSGAGASAIVTGALSGEPSFFPWQDVRFALGLGSVANPTIASHFLGNQGSTVVPPPWRAALGAGGTVAPVAGAVDGAIALTTTAADTDFVTVALGVNFTPTNGLLYAEFRIKVNTIVTRAQEVGISDAMSETAGLAFSDHSINGVTAVADNAAIFAFDTTAGSPNWLVNTSKTLAEQAVNTGIPVVAGQYYVLAILVDNDGDAQFFIDGELVATVTNAVTPTVNFTPWISTLAHANVATVATVDFAGIIATA